MLKTHLDPDLIQEDQHEIPCILIYPQSISRVFTILRDQLRFSQLTDITAVDFPSRTPRFEIVYHLLSHQENKRLRVKTCVDVKLPSLTPVFKAANWYEREIFDFFGIEFLGHPRLERLLTDYDFEGHPLRKDFPVYGHTQVRHDGENLIKEPVHLTQPYREFDFTSVWSGSSTPKA